MGGGLCGGEEGGEGWRRVDGVTSESELPTASPSCCLGCFRRGMGIASEYVIDSGVLLLSGLRGAPDASTTPTAMRGIADCERRAVLRPPTPLKLRPPAAWLTGKALLRIPLPGGK